LKRESAVLEARRLELEAAGNKRVELERLIEQSISLASEFEPVFAAGSMEEKRLIVRAFVTNIELNPENGTGLISFSPLPDLQHAKTF